MAVGSSSFQYNWTVFISWNRCTTLTTWTPPCFGSVLSYVTITEAEVINKNTLFAFIRQRFRYTGHCNGRTYIKRLKPTTNTEMGSSHAYYTQTVDNTKAVQRQTQCAFCCLLFGDFVTQRLWFWFGDFGRLFSVISDFRCLRSEYGRGQRDNYTYSSVTVNEHITAPWSVASAAAAAELLQTSSRSGRNRRRKVAPIAGCHRVYFVARSQLAACTSTSSSLLFSFHLTAICVHQSLFCPRIA